MLKKPSINEELQQQAKDLLSENLSVRAISFKIKVPYSTLWRNVQVLGLIKKREREPSKYFSWNDFDNKSVI